MPSKSKRVAARQAQLSGRGKRSRPHVASGVAAETPSSGGHARDSAPVVEEGVASPSSTATAPRGDVVGGWGPAASARPRGRAIARRPAEAYFRPEVRRIGLMAALIFAILIVLYWVLR
ncbi:MAG: hypothetical protein HY535_00415 [Chloroflexi bacterium]|nr:hypothetical protein [Chloroflexota bacterium]